MEPQSSIPFRKSTRFIVSYWRHDDSQSDKPMSSVFPIQPRAELSSNGELTAVLPSVRNSAAAPDHKHRIRVLHSVGIFFEAA